MALSFSQTRPGGQARRPVDDGLPVQEAAPRAGGQAPVGRTSFASRLARNRILDNPTMAKVTSQEPGIPRFDSDAMDDMDMSAVARLADDNPARRAHVLPLSGRGSLRFVAASDRTGFTAPAQINRVITE